VVEATIKFDIASQWRVQRLPTRCDPVENRALQSFCIVSPSARRTLLYKVCDVNNTFGRTIHEAVLQPRYHMKKVLEDSMFSTLLMCKRVIGLLSKLSHAQYTIVKQSTDSA
jgi:hypothetical protein